MNILIFFSLFSFLILDRAEDTFTPPPLPSIPSKLVKVTDDGALGDGTTDDTKFIQKAIDEVLAAGGGTVEVPDGIFLTGPLTLGSNLRLRLSAKGVLKMLPMDSFPKPADGSSDPCLLSAHDAHDIEISGSGTIDGQGAPWWPAYRAKQLENRRPQLVALRQCDTILMQGITTLNPPNCHFAISHSKNVTFASVIVSAPGTAPNTDGLNLSGIQNCYIHDCTIATGDDNLVLLTTAKSETGPGCSHIFITRCHFGVGHGLSIGSYTSGGVEDVLATDCSFEGTKCGIRLKAGRDRGGLVQNITYKDMTMINVGTPISIESYYPKTPKDAALDTAQTVTEKTPIWRQITMSGITAKNCTSAGSFWGLPEMPVSSINLENVAITAHTGWIINNAHDIVFKTCTISVDSGPTVKKLNADVAGLDAPTAPAPEPPINPQH